uniref:Ty3 transposon capsid-like protein domain-containing protein n=1 Tax=Tanacetum cinerariifolium TaxID=118510 RepID=A0A699HQP3_TANCI|nr:hypothetical protein [Tanacetum cinerariifolium]
MVGTRNSSLEVHVDKAIKNWVTEHVSCTVGCLNDMADRLATSIHELMLQQQYLVTDVNELKGGKGSSRFSRMSKLDFPKIHEDDVQGAFAWHLQFIRNNGDVTWAVYGEAILKRFRGLDDDPILELKNLRYETSMKQYQSKFEMLLTQVNITEAQSISMSIAGLLPTIEINVRMFKLKSLTDAFILSNLQEAAHNLTKQKYVPILPTSKIVNTPYYNRSTHVHARNTTTTLVLPAPNT